MNVVIYGYDDFTGCEITQLYGLSHSPLKSNYKFFVYLSDCCKNKLFSGYGFQYHKSTVLKKIYPLHHGQKHVEDVDNCDTSICYVTRKQP